MHVRGWTPDACQESGYFQAPNWILAQEVFSMVRKVDRELKLEAIRMASLAQLPSRVPQPLRVHRDLLQPRKESLHPALRITRSIRAAHIHNRRLRVSVFPGEYQQQTPVRTYIHMARFVPGVLCIVVRRHNLLLWRNMQVPCETSPGIHSPGDILIMTTFNCTWSTLGHVKA